MLILGKYIITFGNTPVAYTCSEWKCLEVIVAFAVKITCFRVLWGVVFEADNNFLKSPYVAPGKEWHSAKAYLVCLFVAVPMLISPNIITLDLMEGNFLSFWSLCTWLWPADLMWQVGNIAERQRERQREQVRHVHNFLNI